MKILIVSQHGYGAWFILRLQSEGHQVGWYLLKKKYINILRGIVPKPLLQKPDFAKYDLVLFDLTGEPRLAEEAHELAPTIGDGDLQTKLEEDRLFGIQTMEHVGIEVPPYEVFNDLETAKKFIAETDKRLVFKPFGDQPTSLTYVSESSEDLLEYIDKLAQDIKGSFECILQEKVDGIEISTEGYFNGDEFFLINGTLEEKKLMNHRIGPNTGCAGNLVWHYGQEPRIFKRGLGLMKGFLQEKGFVGMLDLNTIASDSHLYGLEWTPRFGYDATATMFSSISSGIGDFLHAIAIGDSPVVNTSSSYAASTRLSIPPYPSEVEGHYRENVPINGVDFEDLDEFYLYDAKFEDNDLVSAGCSGFIGAPIGTGSTIEGAWAVVSEKIKRVRVPDVQYRTDLYRCTRERYEELSAQGWLK